MAEERVEGAEDGERDWRSEERCGNAAASDASAARKGRGCVQSARSGEGRRVRTLTAVKARLDDLLGSSGEVEVGLARDEDVRACGDRIR